jgi:hypothetical protein
MSFLKRFRLWLTGLALGMLAALMIAPQTRWLVLDQVSGLIHAKEEPELHWPEPDAAARRYPNDFEIRLAAALLDAPRLPMSASNEDQSRRMEAKLSRLRVVAAQFPDHPSVYAALVRSAPLIRRDLLEDDLETRISQWKPKDWLPTAEQLAAFDADAAVGERVDPDNAFFPMIRTVGLYLAHRDNDALAAIRRAAGKSRWDDYATDEFRGKWKLCLEDGVGRGALAREQVTFTVLFHEANAYRSVAKLSTSIAAKEEKAGRFDAGWAIRRDLLHCGDVMRTQSRFVVGAMEGTAVSEIAICGPTGLTGARDLVSRDRIVQARADDLRASLRRNGQGRYVDTVQSELAARQQVMTLIYSRPFAEKIFPIKDLAGCWTADFVVLCSIGWLLMFGGVAWVIRRGTRIRLGEGMTLTTFWSIVVGLCVGLTSVLTSFRIDPYWSHNVGLFNDKKIFLPAIINPSGLSVAVVIGMVSVALGLAAGIFRGFLLTGLKMILTVAGWVIIAIACLGAGLAIINVLQPSTFTRTPDLGLLPLMTIEAGVGVLTLVLARSSAPIHGVVQASLAYSLTTISGYALLHVVFLMSFYHRMAHFLSGDATGALHTSIVLSISSLAATVILAVVAFIVTLKRRVPISVGLTRGFAAAAMPLACILILVYGGLIPVTLRHEQRLQYALDRTLQHEGKYIAELSGQQWPGPVKWE